MDRLARHLPALRWRLTRWQQALGFWGLLAIAVMFGALLIEAVVIQPAVQQDAQRRQEVEIGIAEQPQQVQVTEPAVVEKLPEAADFAPRLEAVLALIQQRGFTVEQTNLSYSNPGDTGLQRLEVEVPLTGPYSILRDTLAAIAQEPAVRIESLSLERKDISSGLLSIVLKLSLLGVVQ